MHADLFRPTPGSAAARSGAERAAEAFDRLIEPHRADLRAFILRITEGDEAIAESILKETLYRAAQEPARYLQRPAAVRPMLILTARKVLNDGERHAPAGHDDRPYTPRSLVVPASGPAEPAPATTVVSALRDLSAGHRDLILELFYGGVSLEDAAADRAVPLETIKSRLHEAMRALRTALDQRLAENHGAL